MPITISDTDGNQVTLSCAQIMAIANGTAKIKDMPHTHPVKDFLREMGRTGMLAQAGVTLDAALRAYGVVKARFDTPLAANFSEIGIFGRKGVFGQGTLWRFRGFGRFREF